jgi:hypothetical protein
MVICPNCKSIKVKVLDLNFAHLKKEGEPADKNPVMDKQFYCEICHHGWCFDPESEKLYLEYIQLKNETTLVVQDMKRGGKYHPQYIDMDKLTKRKDIARRIVSSYQHVLDINPGEWYELHQDASI